VLNYDDNGDGGGSAAAAAATTAAADGDNHTFSFCFSVAFLVDTSDVTVVEIKVTLTHSRTIKIEISNSHGTIFPVTLCQFVHGKLSQQ